MTASLDEKLSKILSKIAIWVAMGLASAIFAIAGIMYTDAKQRISMLEERVSFLYQDKVSRAEFREEMAQLRMQNDANKSDIIARQESTKADILARIELLIPKGK